jgi:hypothetical protein
MPRELPTRTIRVLVVMCPHCGYDNFGLQGIPWHPAHRVPGDERFARDFRRVALDWDVLCEPEPVGHALIFPDFALHHRRAAAAVPRLVS